MRADRRSWFLFLNLFIYFSFLRTEVNRNKGMIACSNRLQGNQDMRLWAMKKEGGIEVLPEMQSSGVSCFPVDGDTEPRGRAELPETIGILWFITTMKGSEFFLKTSFPSTISSSNLRRILFSWKKVEMFKL